MTSKGDIILLYRAFLEACLEEKLSQENSLVLGSDQCEFLELVANLATFSTDAIMVPKDLLEAFLAEKVSLYTSKHGNIDGLRGE